MNSVRHAVRAACAILVGVTATNAMSSEPSSIESFVASQPAELQPLFATLISEGERNAVLNLNRLGLAAMQRGEQSIAERAFDESLRRIEAIYAEDPDAKTAKSKFSEEKVKDFKGEPYERAMAYYYRGILYLSRGDYENARASFLSGEYQDTMSESEEFSGDFAILSYLAGWASQCAGDTDRAATFYETARVSEAELVAPTPGHASLVLVDSGVGPRKTATGKHKELLEFVAGEPGTVPQVVGPEGATLMPARGSDLYWQASTRGGRPIQAILDNKVVWKDTTQGVADVATTVSELASTASMLSTDVGQSADFAGAGLIAAGIGLFVNAAAASMKPAADTRYWDTLPATVYVGTATRIAPEAWQVKWGDSPPVAAQLASEAGQCTVTWASSSAGAAVSSTAPNSDLYESGSKRRSKTAKAKNDALTASVLGW